MKTVRLHSKNEIERFLRRNTFLYLYAVGDLDDFFWGDTTWYALVEKERIEAVVLLYAGAHLPILLGLTEEPADPMRELLQSIMQLLPERLYAHLSGNLADVLREKYDVRSHGEHHKMALANKLMLEKFDTSEAVPLSPSDVSDIEGFYRVSYPGNWFDPRMLGTNCYYGIRCGRDLVSAAGVHVYSTRYRVAALGNIATHPDFRNRGFAATVCAKLCETLSRTVDHIGLNVKADNRSAITCYQRLGFETIASYEECSLELR